MEQRNVVLYIASSLDGYIATKEDKLDWLFSVAGEGDNGYSDFLESVDIILMGRVTYDWVMDHENGNFPYRGKECYVFSNTKTGGDGNVQYVGSDIVPFITDLKNKPGKNIWLVGGGALLSAFLREKLVDEVIVTFAPRLLGQGIPLFRDNPFPTDLVLKSVRRFNQFAELRYDVVR